MTKNDTIGNGERKAIAYVRVSSTKQADSGLGEAAQRDAIANWATMHSATVQVFADLGVSGTRKNRPTLDDAIATARRAQCSLVVLCLSRLARSTAQTLAIIERLRTAKVSLVSIREAIDTESATGKAMLGMLAVMAQMEADLASERTKDAMRILRARGLRTGGLLPYGYRQEYCYGANGCVLLNARGVPQKKLIKIEDERVVWVMNEIAALHKEGMSLRRIAAELNKRGALTARGCAWHSEQVNSVIRVAKRRAA